MADLSLVQKTDTCPVPLDNGKLSSSGYWHHRQRAGNTNLNETKSPMIALQLTTAALWLACAGPCAEDGARPPERPTPLQPLWQVQLPLHSPVNVVIGTVGDERILLLQGTHPRRGAAVAAYSASGRKLWEFGAGAGSTPGAYLQWLRFGKQQTPSVLFSYVPKARAHRGGAWVLDARTGKPLHHIQNRTHFGNNNSTVADLDQDGIPELYYADQRSIACLKLDRPRLQWRYGRSVLFCWGLPGVVDADGDGFPDLVFGNEYDEPDGTSSIAAIDADGQLLWRRGGILEDLGSTPTIVLDVNGDGAPELLKVGLDLEHRRRLPWNHLYIFRPNGELVRTVPLGFTGIALADFDGDGHLEGIGLSNTRDGGSNGERAIRCVELDGTDTAWRIPVPRAYLDTNSPIAADFDGDGEPEAVVGTGNPSGYGRLPNTEPWGDLYLVEGNGTVAQEMHLPGWPVNLAACDLTGDGRSELLVVIDGQPGWLLVLRTAAPATRNDWPTPFGNAQRNGTALPLVRP